MKKLFFIIIILMFNTLEGKELNIPEVRDVLKYVETESNPAAVGDNGKSYGILQIQQVAIDDVNRKYGTHYTHQDAFNIKCAEEIFELYIKMWVNNLEKREGRKATIEDIVRIWNGGPKGYRKRSTIKYYNKFKRFSQYAGIPEQLKYL